MFNFEQIPSRGLSQKEVVEEVSAFQRGICASLFKDLDDDTIERHFYKIFCTFLELTKNKSSQIKNFIYASITVFLLKVSSSYANPLCNAFSEIVRTFTSDDYDSTLIVAIFAYLTNVISPMKLPEFLLMTPIFHQFFQTSVLSSDRISNIISNISLMSTDWLEIFFAKYIRAAINTGERNILSASLSVYNKNRRALINQLFLAGEEQNWSLKYLSILAYFISAGNIVLDTRFLPAQVSAFNSLLENTSFSTKTDIFIVLSAISKGLKIENKGNNIISLTLNDKVIEFDYTNHVNDPTFYTLHLPLEMLVPDSNNLSTVIGVKVETLGRIAAFTTDEKELNTIIDVLYDVHNKGLCHFSSILRAISKCANYFLSFTRSSKFYYFLNSALLCKEQSWYHSSEILHALQNIDTKYYPQVFGSDGQKKIRVKLIKYAVNPNKQFALEAISFLKKLSANHIEEIAHDIWFDTNFFDMEDVHAHVFVLTKLLNSSREIHILHGFIDCIYELYQQFDYIEFLSDLFTFLSFFDHTKNRVLVLKDLIQTAVIFIHYGIQYLTGEVKPLSVPEEEANKYSTMLFEYFAHHPVDITDANSHLPHKHLRPVHAATVFILSLGFGVVDRKFLISACLRTFKFFPDVCLLFMTRNFNDFTDEEKIELVSNLYPYINNINSVFAHVKWTEIALSKMNPGDLPRGFIDTITKNSIFFIENHNNFAAKYLYFFADFLGSLHEQYRDQIQTLFCVLPPEKARVFYDMAKSRKDLFVKRYQLEFTNLKNICAQISKDKPQKTTDDLAQIPTPNIDINDFTNTAAYYSAIGRSDLIEISLMESYMKNSKIDFSAMTISPQCALPIFNIVYKLEKDQIPHIKDIFSLKDIEEGKEDGVYAWALYNIDDFIEQFLALEKIKKNHLLFLCKLIASLRGEELERIRDRILPKLLNPEYKNKKLHAALSAVAILSHTLKNSKEIRDKIFDFMGKLTNEVDLKLAARVFYSVVAYGGTSHDHNVVIKKYYNKAVDCTQMVVSIFEQIRIIIKARKNKRTTTSISDKLIEYLNSELPSGILSCIRLAFQIVHSYSVDDALVALKNSIEAIIDVVKLWIYLPPVITSYSKFIQAILRQPELRYLHSVIMYNCFNEPISFNNPSQLIYALTLTEDAIPHAGIESSQFDFLFNITQLMLSFKNARIFEAGTRCYVKILAKNVNKEKTAEDALVASLGWLANNIGFDHYYIMQFIESWRKLMMRCSTAKKIGESMAIEFVKFAPRKFIPFLIYERCNKEFTDDPDRDEFRTDMMMGQRMIEDPKLNEAISEYLAGHKIEALDKLYK